ncbi:hypothetical protein DH2020_046777 [Rehmannia glutinosa]|uniref:Endonuclease/exonuclease/phosphatase domain-containing protein n=1 Tax=Rehmannia glutinosa TaxID=99300 RepID=A0ABR0UAC6_REHGL
MAVRVHDSASIKRFTVLSYNILADYLATDHWQKLYFHIPGYIMDWNWRRRNISFELGLWSADILCFQEVDRFQDIEAELKPRGYSGIWKVTWKVLSCYVIILLVFKVMRTGDPADGCAIFWRLSSGSSASSNRVVVCNIHVLFNPKRGDVKLGQIRVLLDRAHAVSKLWDDAPVVICGDFNCTPKLDLSELPRDKVSGQTSAEIRPSRPGYPDFRRLSADNSTQASAVNCEKIEHRDMPSDAQNLARLHSSTDAPSTGRYSKPGCSMIAVQSRVSQLHTPSRRLFDGSLNSALALDDIESPICPARDTNEIAFLESSCENIPANSTKVRECVESNLQTLSDNHSSDITKISEPTLTSNSYTSQLEGPSEKLSPNSLDVASSKHEAVTLSVSDADDNHDKPSYESSSCESTGADFVLDEKFEHLSLNELVDGATDKLSEDCDSFLSELHSTGQSSLHSHDDGILSDTLYVERPSPSAWTPAEIETATGSADHKVVEHPLKLTSSYAEVENSSGLRDSSGEPFITSYHRLFSGTVDYIWHSEGLQTVKILAPIPKHVMQQTRGFPTKKWGSDHMALVSEFAFTKDSSSENASQ